MASDGTGTDRRRVVWGGILAGVGLGGFFDGIVLHQILQWHHMVSNVRPPTTVEDLRLNTLADGLFHAAAWALTLAGLFLLWSGTRRRRSSWPAGLLAGLVLAGWGFFNVVESLIDHHLLALHHIRPGENQLAWDLAFLAWGALMGFGGWSLARKSFRAAPGSREGVPEA